MIRDIKTEEVKMEVSELSEDSSVTRLLLNFWDAWLKAE